MPTVTASNVKDLRERTAAGMMDCKKALAESNGNLEKAIDWLRKKGLSTAAKKAGRAMPEGLVGIHLEGTKGSIVEVNSETDFVARNEQFQDFVRNAAKVALSVNGNLKKLTRADYPNTKRTVQEELTHLISVIGENLSLRRCAFLSVKKETITTYMHTTKAPNLGRIGVLISLESKANQENLVQIGRQIAMHIAATNPISITIQDIPSENLERERSVLKEQALASGKSEAIVDKMIEGRLRKYYEEVVLLEQKFVIDGERKISKVLEDEKKEIGSPVKINRFVRFGLGEGV
jgi:elongation factor Ts